MSTPPEGLPVYRVPTGPEDAAFRQRVSELIGLGYELHEGPAVTFDGKQRWSSSAVNTRPAITRLSPGHLRRGGNRVGVPLPRFVVRHRRRGSSRPGPEPATGPDDLSA
ncbi:DUF1737 domain-containing protein [Streptomyces sp. NPDC091271]|uniref:DUF1737 domain-containing protein n=1 Tax=Streptomyces sp. NPDC091271 TaxID=3365980 RepID=UPI0037F9738C